MVGKVLLGFSQGGVPCHPWVISGLNRYQGSAGQDDAPAARTPRQCYHCRTMKLLTVATLAAAAAVCSAASKKKPNVVIFFGDDW